MQVEHSLHYDCSGFDIYIHVQWNLTIPATLGTCKTSVVAGSQRTSPIHWPEKLTGLGPANLAALARWPAWISEVPLYIHVVGEV